jgi:hypothetical protein
VSKKKKNEPRVVAWVDPTAFVEGLGYRVSLVVEGDDGHFPTGTWPYTGAPGETQPWFWGPTLKDAERACDEFNAERGISSKEAAIIVAQTMANGMRSQRCK